MSGISGIAFNGVVSGSGPTVVLIPSLGRGGSDFDLVAARLRASGFSTLALTGQVRSRSSDQSFEELADGVAGLCQRRGTAPLHLVGHAYGQALARCMVTRHPGVFASMVLLACGAGMPDDDLRRSLEAATDGDLARTDPGEHLRQVSRAFFAPGNDAAVWAQGWYPEVARAEMEALLRTPFERWREGAVLPTLVVQGLEDVIAPPEFGRRFASTMRCSRLVEIASAGHALLPEQPELVAQAVLDFLRDVKGDA